MNYSGEKIAKVYTDRLWTTPSLFLFLGLGLTIDEPLSFLLVSLLTEMALALHIIDLCEELLKDALDVDVLHRTALLELQFVLVRELLSFFC